MPLTTERTTTSSINNNNNNNDIDTDHQVSSPEIAIPHENENHLNGSQAAPFVIESDEGRHQEPRYQVREKRSPPTEEIDRLRPNRISNMNSIEHFETASTNPLNNERRDIFEASTASIGNFKPLQYSWARLIGVSVAMVKLDSLFAERLSTKITNYMEFKRMVKDLSKDYISGVVELQAFLPQQKLMEWRSSIIPLTEYIYSFEPVVNRAQQAFGKSRDIFVNCIRDLGLEDILIFGGLIKQKAKSMASFNTYVDTMWVALNLDGHPEYDPDIIFSKLLKWCSNYGVQLGQDHNLNATSYEMLFS